MGSIAVDRSPGFVTLTIEEGDAEHLQSELSDLLCWVRGYQAAASKSARQHAPMGIEGARELNIAMKRALSRSLK